MNNIDSIIEILNKNKDKEETKEKIAPLDSEHGVPYKELVKEMKDSDFLKKIGVSHDKDPEIKDNKY